MIKAKKVKDYEGVNLIDVNNEPTPHDPTNVLEIEVVRIWGERYVWRITYQDKDILHDSFEDKELNVSCRGGFPYFEEANVLNLRGCENNYDLKIGCVDYEGLIKLVNKVDAVNKKYRDEKLLKEQCIHPSFDDIMSVMMCEQMQKHMMED